MEITLGGTALVLLPLIFWGIPAVIIIWLSIQRHNGNTMEISGISTEKDESGRTTTKTFTWRRLLVFSLLCLVLLPCNFIFTLIRDLVTAN